MTCRCKRRIELNGRTHAVGALVDILPGDVTDRVRACFEPPAGEDWPKPYSDANPAPAKAIAPAQTPSERDDLSLDELRRRLTGMGVAFSPSSNRNALSKLYQEQSAILSKP